MLGELIEEGVFAVVRGPDCEVAGPGDAGLGGLPEKFGVWMFGEFVETNIAAVNGHGVRVRRESNDAGAVLEFDVADLDFFGEGSRAPLGIEGLAGVTAMDTSVAAVTVSVVEPVTLPEVA